MELITILILIFVTLFAEGCNTAIELLCDHVTPELHPRIKQIKDVSAFSVLLIAIMDVIVGLIIFIPYLRGVI